MHINWSYTTLGGQTVAQNQPDAMSNQEYDILMGSKRKIHCVATHVAMLTTNSANQRTNIKSKSS
jgi:intein-encoded DNA endonuclease-like protein